MIYYLWLFQQAIGSKINEYTDDFAFEVWKQLKEKQKQRACYIIYIYGGYRYIL